MYIFKNIPDEMRNNDYINNWIKVYQNRLKFDVHFIFYSIKLLFLLSEGWKNMCIKLNLVKYLEKYFLFKKSKKHIITFLIE